MNWLKKFLYLLLFLFLLLNIVSAFQAYKFTHFYSTITKVKRPDQMSGWEKTKAILVGINYPKKKITELPSVPFDTFSVRTEDGLNLKGWLIRNKTLSASRKAIIMFHGHGGNKSGVMREAEAFAKLNYNVYLVDFRSHGESDGNVCTIGHDEAKDVKSVYELVKTVYGDSIILWGISLGAATIIRAVSAYPAIKPQKLILEMPFGSLQDAVKGRLRTMHLPEQPLAALLTFWGGTEHGFWAFNMSPEEYAKDVHCPVLLQWGIHDMRVSASETQTIFKNLGTTSKTLVLYEAAHEDLLKKEPAKWTGNVTAFLSR